MNNMLILCLSKWRYKEFFCGNECRCIGGWLYNILLSQVLVWKYGFYVLFFGIKNMILAKNVGLTAIESRL